MLPEQLPINLRKAGNKNNLDEEGFSITTGTLQRMHSLISTHISFARRLPMRTLCWSFSDKSGSPNISGGESPRRGGGQPPPPFLPRRALEKDPQGIPIHRSRKCLCRISCLNLLFTCLLNTSSRGFRDISNDSL